MEIYYEKPYKNNYTRRDKKAIDELNNIENGKYSNAKGLAVRNKWLRQFGGFERQINSSRDLAFGLLFSPEYNWIDSYHYLQGNMFSIDAFHNELQNVDFIKDVKELKIPVYFFMGRHDYVTPFKLVENFYNQLSAPGKEIIWFENSAHSPNFEEPGKFSDVMSKIVGKYR